MYMKLFKLVFVFLKVDVYFAQTIVPILQGETGAPGANAATNPPSAVDHAGYGHPLTATRNE